MRQEIAERAGLGIELGVNCAPSRYDSLWVLSRYGTGREFFLSTVLVSDM
jgi:hypothetical protein